MQTAQGILEVGQAMEVDLMEQRIQLEATERDLDTVREGHVHSFNPLSVLSCCANSADSFT